MYNSKCYLRTELIKFFMYLVNIGNIIKHDITFLVFGRLSDANFIELADLALPASLQSICQAVPSEDYRNDISSSAIRASQRQSTSPSES